MKRCALVAVLATAFPVAAQLPAVMPAGSYVMDRWYPKVFWSPTEGFTAGGYFSLVAPLRYSEYDAPPAQRIGVSLNGQAATSGSRFIRLDAFAPYYWVGWRLRATVSLERRNRDPFFGVGPDTPYDDANTVNNPRFYQARRDRTWARLEVQRNVAGGLRLLVGAHAERWRLDPLAETSVLGQLALTDPTLPIGVSRTDVAFRGGAVFDTRDNEAMPRRGILIEAIHTVADAGTAGDETYDRTLVSARGYLTLHPQWDVSARVAAQRMGGTPSLGSLYLIDQSDMPINGLGGSQTHRGLAEQRLLGKDKLWTNLDVHYTAFEIPTLVRVAFVAFVDAGRVFQTEDFRLTTEGLQLGAGSGVLLTMFRNAVLGLTVAGGPDGLMIHAHTRWAY